MKGGKGGGGGVATPENCCKFEEGGEGESSCVCVWIFLAAKREKWRKHPFFFSFLQKRRRYVRSCFSEFSVRSKGEKKNSTCVAKFSL